jgi:hypothetical protein
MKKESSRRDAVKNGYFKGMQIQDSSIVLQMARNKNAQSSPEKPSGQFLGLSVMNH